MQLRIPINHQPRSTASWRLCALARNPITNIPTNNLSEPEHTNPKTFVEICISVEQKNPPATTGH
jgi:hypothetical protein